jgi:hypothetical protein
MIIRVSWVALDTCAAIDLAIPNGITGAAIRQDIDTRAMVMPHTADNQIQNIVRKFAGVYPSDSFKGV